MTPEPRSCTRISSCLAPIDAHDLDVDATRKPRMIDHRRCRQVERRPAGDPTRQARCGLPTDTSRPATPHPAEHRSAAAAAPWRAPMSTVIAPSAATQTCLAPARVCTTSGRAVGQSMGEQVAREYADAVAAHLSEAAVSIAVVHEPGIRPAAPVRTARRIPSAPSPNRRSQSRVTSSAGSATTSSGSGRIRKSFPVPWPLANRMIRS